MPRPRVHLGPHADSLAPALARLRAEFEIPAAFPAEALAEAGAAAAAAARGDRRDRRDLPMCTIDPAGSRDLDQAFALARTPTGFTVHYAIADVAAFVVPGGAVDAEAHRRAVTTYLPDGRVPLYPPSLSEGAASLLPDVDRPCVLWRIELDHDGEVLATHVERALVRSRRQWDYDEAQRALDAGHLEADHPLVLLREVGTLRRAVETRRGGVSLDLPEQEVERTSDDRYALVYRAGTATEAWNAQLSLLTGMEAARLCAGAGLALLRTLPPVTDEALAPLRRAARALGLAWPATTSYPELVRSLDHRVPAHAAFLSEAARLLRGAAYEVWRPSAGQPAPPVHGAIAAPYAHVTAPLRRLADRPTTELALHACAGTTPSPALVSTVESMPEVMAAGDRRSRAVDRAAIDLIEAAVLHGREGETFEAVVIDRVRDGARVQLADPAVLSVVRGLRTDPGAVVRLRLDAVDLDRRTVSFTLRR